MIYGEDYYERGLETGISNYQKYRWIPELTIPMAMTIIDFLNIKPTHTILDYGCSKGYLVKSLRLLHRQAWGTDISEYALSKADSDTIPFLIPTQNLLQSWYRDDFYYDMGICKDVLEHIPEKELIELLELIKVKQLFVVVPLGENGKYRALANGMDVSHIICENEDWWASLFRKCGWVSVYVSTVFPGIKDSYDPGTHLFMVNWRVG